MLIATVPYVGKRLHLDPDPNPDPDPKLNYGSGSEHANNFGSGRIRIHNPDPWPCIIVLTHFLEALSRSYYRYRISKVETAW
jgi:hypothetical protein